MKETHLDEAVDSTPVQASLRPTEITAHAKPEVNS